MNRLITMLAVSACLLAFISPIEVSANGFEGVMKRREIEVDFGRLQALLPSPAGENPGEVAAAIFDIPVERILSMKGEAEDGVEVTEITIHIKGSKIRTDLSSGEGPRGYQIADLEQGTFSFVMPDEGRYVEWNVNEMEAASAHATKMRERAMEGLTPEQRAQLETFMNMEPPRKEKKVRPLGKTKSVNGIEAAGYEVKSENEISIGWVTGDAPELSRKIKNFREKSKKMKPPKSQVAAEDILFEHGMPVRVQTLKLPLGRSDYEIEEITSLERKPVSDDLFVIPEGLAKTSLGEMMMQHQTQQRSPRPPAPPAHPQVKP